MLSAPGIALLVCAVQFSAIILISLASGLSYHVAIYGNAGGLGSVLASGILAGLAYVAPVFTRRDSSWYEAMANRRSVRQVVVDWTTAVFVVAVIAFLTKTADMFSRGALLLMLAFGLVVLIALEAVIARLIAAALRSARAAPRRVLLLGDKAVNERYRSELAGQPDIHVVGMRSLPVSADDAARQKDLEALVAQSVAEARHLQADDVLLTIPLSRLDVIERSVQAFSMSPATMHLVGDDLSARFAGLRVTDVGRLPTLRLSRPALSPVQAMTKRVLDVVLATIGLMLLAPAFPIVALLIKLDSPGPVFFMQKRRGYNLRDFRILKFRTMSTLDDGPVVVQAKHNDPRITRIGAWLRRLNIDELPQLVNVVKGDMSIVGPRPHALAHDTAFETRIARYPRRLNVRPGITGWAQVNGLRGETDTEDKMARRVEADLFYIDNWSLLLDLKILALTVISPRAYRNAR